MPASPKPTCLYYTVHGGVYNQMMFSHNDNIIHTMLLDHRALATSVSLRGGPGSSIINSFN